MLRNTAILNDSRPLVRIQKVRKHYGPVEVLRDVSFDIAPSEVVCILGPSGSGKSTLLRCINQLEHIDAASRSWGNHAATESMTASFGNLPPVKSTISVAR